VPWIVALSGAGYTLTGLSQLFAPRWFFENIGNFPPFNRHYVGDLGAFILAMGLGLLVAARNPAQHRSLIGVVALGSVLHLLNHLYDDWLSADWSLGTALTQTLPLALVAAALAWVYCVDDVAASYRRHPHTP
jgi:uncharacterized membrane protein